MASYLDEAIAALRRFEGSVPWMYLDTAGKVTVGVGLMLPSPEAAKILPFLHAERAATADEIAAEFARVHAMKPGLLARLYRRAKGITLSDAIINERLHQTLLGFEGYLRADIRGYDGLPDAVKVALLDMVYNLGPGKLFAEFPKLIDAVDAGQWKKAATSSLRRGPGAARNEWTRQQFLSAAETLKKLDAELEGTALGTMIVRGLMAGAAAWVTVLLLGEAKRTSNAKQRLVHERVKRSE